MAKIYSLEQDGISVFGRSTKAEAKRAWTEARDTFAKVAAENSPWVFNYGGAVVVVYATPGSWTYSMVTPDSREGTQHGTCSYTARDQAQAIAVAVGSLAQRLWSADVSDDAEFFDAIAKVARIYPNEVKSERDNFLTVAAHWRQHLVAA